jgi:hypothetical protein
VSIYADQRHVGSVDVLLHEKRAGDLGPMFRDRYRDFVHSGSLKLNR